MRRITWAILAWTALGIVGIWALDAASHPTGADPAGPAPLKPPAWALFEFRAIGFVLLGAIWNGVLSAVGTASDRVRIEERPMRRCQLRAVDAPDAQS
jgi:hypothetical protein